MAGRTGSLIEHDRMSRTERLWGFHQIRDLRVPDQLNWSVIVSAASDEVMADLSSQKRVFYSLLFIFAVAFGLAGYGAARSLMREYLEYSVKLKDETNRLLEVGDELNEALKRAESHESFSSESLAQSTQKGREISVHMEARAEALTESAAALRDVVSEAAVSTRQLESVSEVLAGIEQGTQSIGRIEQSLEEIHSRLGELNDLVFKAQLVGFNASIEASRAGQFGKGFANVAQEIRGFSDITERISHDVSEAVSRSRRQLFEARDSFRQKVAGAEQLVADISRASSRLDSSLPSIIEAIEASAQSLKEQDEVVRNICREVEIFESSFNKSGNIRGELNRYVQDIREQSYRIEDVVQDLGNSVKGLRVRSRLKKSQPQPVFQRGTDISPERARADAVDRLAQKMRPRLVVESEGHEPEVNDSSFKQESSKRRALSSSHDKIFEMQKQ
ncbi:methyl-accepting chemotaxis protein [bacterium]|nr:methyl-accepting chemotaxis protein [bacterium]